MVSNARIHFSNAKTLFSNARIPFQMPKLPFQMRKLYFQMPTKTPFSYGNVGLDDSTLTVHFLVITDDNEAEQIATISSP
jgi:hypothetical protein